MKTVLINNYDHLHFFVENVIEALKKTFKTKVNQNKAVFLIYGALWSIVDGPSKLLCHLLPYLKKKEKRIDYNICEAVNKNRALSEIDM